MDYQSEVQEHAKEALPIPYSNNYFSSVFSTRITKCLTNKDKQADIYPCQLLQEIYSSTNSWNPKGNGYTQKASDLAIVEALLLAAPPYSVLRK